MAVAFLVFRSLCRVHVVSKGIGGPAAGCVSNGYTETMRDELAMDPDPFRAGALRPSTSLCSCCKAGGRSSWLERQGKAARANEPVGRRGRKQADSKPSTTFVDASPRRTRPAHIQRQQQPQSSSTSDGLGPCLKGLCMLRGAAGASAATPRLLTAIPTSSRRPENRQRPDQTRERPGRASQIAQAAVLPQ